jgi:hypothetical protein
MIVHEASDSQILHVFARVRPDRAAEITATAWHDDPQRLAIELNILRRSCAEEGRPAPIFTITNDDHLPQAILGVLPFGPALGGMIWATTEDWPPLALPSHRWWRVYFLPHVLEPHYRRVEFTALASDHPTRRWLKTLGFTEEGTAYRQGKRGEDFIHCAWLNPDPTVGIHV